MSSNICTGKSQVVTLDDLRKFPEPEPLGPRHKPIHPASIVDSVINAIHRHGYEVADHRFAVNPSKTKLIGTFDFEPDSENDERTWSAGIISTIDSSVACKLSAGARVFVCDNLMCTGDVVQVRKHTKGFDIGQEIYEMTGKVIDVCKGEQLLIDRQNSVELSHGDACSVLGNALVNNLLPAATVREAGKLWFDDEYEDVHPRSLWGLHNAFTRQIQTLVPTRQLPASVDVGAFFRNQTNAALGDANDPWNLHILDWIDENRPVEEEMEE